MIHAYTIEGVPVQTGDLLCNSDGGESGFFAEFWRAVGTLVPGEVDHVALYLGPAGRCVEAGPFGVITYELQDGRWDAERLLATRGFVDTFYGAVAPVKSQAISDAEQQTMREQIAAYCLAQVAARKPYNANFLDSTTDAAFYCSQLAYKAYLPHGINLNTSTRLFGLLSSPVVFPAEIWTGPWPRIAAAGHETTKDTKNTKK